MAEFAPKGPQQNLDAATTGTGETLKRPRVRVPGTSSERSPKNHKGRNIALGIGGGVAGVGAVIGAWLGIKGGDGSSQQNPDSTVPAGVVSTPTPGFEATSTAPAGITITPEATATPTVETPVFKPGEKGLHESIDQMPITDAQKEVLKKVLEGSNVQIINNKSILALENGIEDRIDCPESAANPNGSRSKCTSIDDAKLHELNGLGLAKSSEIMDSMGPAIQGLVAKRDGGTPIFKAYNADTGVIENIPVTTNAADIVWVYEIIKEPQKANSKEKMMVTRGGSGSTYIYYPEEEVVVVRRFANDSIGNADIGTSSGNQNNVLGKTSFTIPSISILPK